MDKTRELKKQFGKIESFEKFSQLQLPKMTDLDPVISRNPEQVFIIDNTPVNFFASKSSTVIVHLSFEIPFWKYSDLGCLRKIEQVLVDNSISTELLFEEANGYTVSRFNIRIIMMPRGIDMMLGILKKELYFNYTDILSKHPEWFEEEKFWTFKNVLQKAMAENTNSMPLKLWKGVYLGELEFDSSRLDFVRERLFRRDGMEKGKLIVQVDTRPENYDIVKRALRNFSRIITFSYVPRLKTLLK